MEISVPVSENEIALIKHQMANGKTDMPAPEVVPKPELTKAAESLKIKKPEPEPVKVEPVKTAPAKADTKKAETNPTESIAEKSDIVITQAVIDEATKELELFKSSLGNKYDAEMDIKMGKIMASENFDKLIKGGFSAKQAITTMGLMAQGFIKPDTETQRLITKKIEEVKDAAVLTPAGPAETERAKNSDDLMNEWKKSGYSKNATVLNQLTNSDADAKLVLKAMGLG